MHVFSFENEKFGNLTQQFRKKVYIITKGCASDERFELTSQLRRSASRIGDNLAETSGKLLMKDKAQTPLLHLEAQWKP